MTIDIACAYVEMLFKKPIRLARLERETWPFTMEGIYDRDLVHLWIRSKFSEDSVGEREPYKGDFDDGDKLEICKVLGIAL